MTYVTKGVMQSNNERILDVIRKAGVPLRNNEICKAVQENTKGDYPLSNDTCRVYICLAKKDKYVYAIKHSHTRSFYFIPDWINEETGQLKEGITFDYKTRTFKDERELTTKNK